jgi:broad specificity phosphatase PhoE
MRRFILFILTISFYACSVQTVDYYIVRHAEKAIVDSTVKSSDVPLSANGMKRAEELKTQLKDKGIKFIYSTNTVRTKATVQPLSKAIGVPIQLYDGGDTNFVKRLKNLDGNVLIVGHSNTVDDVVNGLMGKPLLKNLPESQFGDLFIVHKKGDNFAYEVGHY